VKLREEEWSDGEVEIRLVLIVWSSESGRRKIVRSRRGTGMRLMRRETLKKR